MCIQKQNYVIFHRNEVKGKEKIFVYHNPYLLYVRTHITLVITMYMLTIVNSFRGDQTFCYFNIYRTLHFYTICKWKAHFENKLRTQNKMSTNSCIVYECHSTSFLEFIMFVISFNCKKNSVAIIHIVVKSKPIFVYKPLRNFIGFYTF